ncbi:MAG TPA: asparaginase, partial [Spirochaetia bacterium]|nr:asparaginase [Spirochaetia bacterium]
METAIRIIITGGTFDKHYDELRGELTFRDSHLPAIL